MKNKTSTGAEFKPTTHLTNPKLTLLDTYSLLSSSESWVLKKMIDGKTNSQGAEELSISLKTVENHITKSNKLNFRSIIIHGADSK